MFNEWLLLPLPLMPLMPLSVATPRVGRRTPEAERGGAAGVWGAGSGAQGPGARREGEREGGVEPLVGAESKGGTEGTQTRGTAACRRATQACQEVHA